MLNLDQLKQAYDLKSQKTNTRDIAKTLECPGSEISYSLNAYELCRNYYEQIVRSTVAPGKDEKEKLKAEYGKLDALHVELKEQEAKLLEREAWMKLFVKNIIYKYKDKDKNLKQQMKKYKRDIDIQTKDTKEENFSLYFDLQKEVKEKLDLKEQLEKYEFSIKSKFIVLFFLGCIFGVGSVILYKILV